MKLSTTRLSALKRKYNRQKEIYNEKVARYKKESKEIEKTLEEEELRFISMTIKATGFPLDQKALLIGVLLDLKKKMEAGVSVPGVDDYLKLYKEFAENHIVDTSSKDETPAQAVSGDE